MMPTALIWCALAASIRYDVPADALLSVYSVERGGCRYLVSRRERDL